MLLQDATGTLISGDGQGRLCLDPSPLWFGLCFSTKWIYIEKEDTMLFTLLRPPYVQLHHLWEVVLKGGARLFPGAGGEGALHLRPPPVDVHKPTGNPLLFCVCKWLPPLSARRGRGRWCPSAYPRGCGFPDSCILQALPRDRLLLPVCKEAPLPSFIRGIWEGAGLPSECRFCAHEAL